MDAWKACVCASYDESTVCGNNGAGHEGHAAAARQQYIQRYRRFLRPDEAVPILDIGCGTGGFLEALRSTRVRSYSSSSTRFATGS